MVFILEDAYALQIDYDPERPDLEGLKEAVQKLLAEAGSRDRVQWEAEIRATRKENRLVKCHESVTFIDRKDIDLMSEAQLVYFPLDIKESIIYFPLDAVTDVEALLMSKKNPFTNEVLTDEQIGFLHRAKLNHKYPKIKVGDFFEELDRRLKGGMDYSEKEYQRKIRELGSLIEETETVVYEVAQIYNFATDYNRSQYNLFLRHKPLKQVIEECSRDDASAKTLNHILNYLKIQRQLGSDQGKIAIIHMAYAIDEFIYMMRNLLTYEELIKERGIANELYWKPDFVEETHYANGNLKCQYYVDEEGNKHGAYSEWYKNGNRCYQSSFNHGIESNCCRYYGTGEPAFQNGNYFYPTGAISASPKNDQPERFDLFDETGNYLGIGTIYKDSIAINFTDEDKLVGVFLQLQNNMITTLSFDRRGSEWRSSISWDLSGNLTAKKLFDDKVRYLCETFYSNGKLKSKQTYDLYEVYHPNGTLKQRGCYDDSKECGLWYLWNNSGTLIKCSFYDDGKLEGLAQSWHHNGQLEAEGLYLNNNKIGAWSYWHINTILAKRESYLNGVQHGSLFEWNEEGGLLKDGYYDQGKQHGLWKSYHINGTVLSETNYDHGKLHGLRKTYYENRILKSEESYNQGKKDGIHLECYSTGKIKKSQSYTNDHLTLEKHYHPNDYLISETQFEAESSVEESTVGNSIFGNLFSSVGISDTSNFINIYSNLISNIFNMMGMISS
jgi:antitoxin component YwqK of YwqJK toxin-antitoxin module